MALSVEQRPKPLLALPASHLQAVLVHGLHASAEHLQIRLPHGPTAPPSSTDWVLRALSILHSEGLNPTRQDVTLMLQNFDGSARDLIDLIEETIMASKAVTP